MIETNCTARHRAMLRAIADGRGRIIASCHPTLTVDGLWCDFSATNDLVGNGLVRLTWAAPIGTTAPAELTRGGIEILATPTRPAA